MNTGTALKIELSIFLMIPWRFTSLLYGDALDPLDRAQQVYSVSLKGHNVQGRI
jgi:hypothetical protein